MTITPPKGGGGVPTWPAVCRRAPALARILIVPFGGTLATGQHHPWESLQKHLELVLYRAFTPDALTSGRATVPVGKPKRVVSKRVTTGGTSQMMQSFRPDKRSVEAATS